VVGGTNQIPRADQRALSGATPADPAGLDRAAIELEPTELKWTELELAEALEAAAPPTRPRAFLRSVITFAVFLAAVAVVWELVKFVGGDPWRADGQVVWNPPLRLPLADDISLPHVWSVLAAFAAPVQRGSDTSLFAYLVGQALFTWREAALGFAAGTLLGLLLATVFVHSHLLERAFVPYVIASQTIPIVALAPMIVVYFGANVFSVVVIATYLTFFPVTIAMMRGLRSPDPRALELMRSYAASARDVYLKVRLPASLPYLFTALKIATTASIVGAIVGEGPGGIPDGLGRAIINFNQYYITAPERLWAAIIASGVLGIVFFLIVGAVELLVLRSRPYAQEA
jgi:NitT/TauT family transport system permease protein